MKIEKRELLQALQKIQGIQKKQNYAIPSVLFRDGFLYSTNLEVTIKIKLNCQEPITIVLDYKELKFCVKKANEYIEITKDGKINGIQIVKYAVNNFPEIKEIPLSSALINFDALKFVSKFVTKDIIHDSLKGVYIDCIENKLVASDGTQIIISNDCSLAELTSFIIPGKSIKALAKTFKGHININYQNNIIALSKDNVIAYVIPHDGVYPNYKLVIPKKTSYLQYFKVNYKEFKNAFEIIAEMQKSKKHKYIPMKTIGNNKLKIYNVANDNNSIIIDVESNMLITVALDYNLFKTFLNNCNTNILFFESNDMSREILHIKHSDYFYGIMPLKFI